MTIARVVPNRQVISDEFLEVVEERMAEARAGDLTMMMVISRDREGSHIMDRSLPNEDFDRAIGMLETLKHELLMHRYNISGPGTEIDEG